MLCPRVILECAMETTHAHAKLKSAFSRNARAHNIATSHLSRAVLDRGIAVCPHTHYTHLHCDPHAKKQNASMARLPALLLLLLVAAAAPSYCARLPTPQALLPVEGGDAAAQQAAVERMVGDAKGAYKTTAPLIGILAQPCSTCPGR